MLLAFGSGVDVVLVARAADAADRGGLVLGVHVLFDSRCQPSREPYPSSSSELASSASSESSADLLRVLIMP